MPCSFLITFGFALILQLELTLKAQIYGAEDPNFHIMYLFDDDCGTNANADNDDNSNTLSNNSSSVSGKNNPLKCAAVVSTGRDDKGSLNSYLPYILLFLYSLPYIFSWGIREFFAHLRSIYAVEYNVPKMAEVANHLGVKMADCYQLEHMMTRVEDFGKGYGSRLIKVR